MDLNHLINIVASEVSNIAVICRSAYGDLVLADSLVQYLLHQYPMAKITLIVDEKNYQLLPYLIHHHHSIVLLAKGSKFRLLIRALKYRKKFDLAVIAKASPSRTMNLFFYLLGAKYNFAYVDDNWHAKSINCGALYSRNALSAYHQAVKFLRLIDNSFTYVPKTLYPKIRSLPIVKLVVGDVDIGDRIDDRVSDQRTILSRVNQIAAHPGPLLLISTSSNRDYAYLGADLYSLILNGVYPAISFKVIISCLPQDIALAEEITKKLVVPHVICATASFNNLMFLLNLVAACFIGEGGIMHIAAALDKPQLALFGRAHDYVSCWRPLSDKARYLCDSIDVKRIPCEKICAELIAILRSI